ncbi:MAG TPA: aspartyl protease family protein [Blastocatellia bacterium]|nr:aspartyl protease family protein [Blastocatellia bacterium]
MKVDRTKSLPKSRQVIRVAILCLALATLSVSVLTPRAAAFIEDTRDDSVRDKLLRECRKQIRKGNYESALKLYRELIDKNAADVQARLGASLVYLKMADYLHCLEEAAEVLKLNKANARAHALAGTSLLRSGFVNAASFQLQQAMDLDPKDALGFGGAAEVDYYEGRLKESRAKSLYAHNLDPDEPDFILTYARSSSRVEDFKEAADAYELFLSVAPVTDTERRDRIRGLITFYRQLAGLHVHQITGANTAELPFQLGSDRRPYINLKVNGRDAKFVIDTGSGFTVLSRDAAKRLGVSELARGGNSQGLGGDGKFQIVYGLVKQLQLGEMKIRMVPCFVRAFHGASDRPIDERADGFIGLSILSHFLTQLDYKEHTMRLERNDDKPALAQAELLPGATVVPFRTTQNGLISIETQFDENTTINAILDSGASSSVISAAAVERLKMHDRIIKGQTASVVGAGGITENVQMLFIRNCKVADLQQGNLRALVMDFNAINETSGFEQSGILGGDFLRHFRVTIDFSRAQLSFQPHTIPAK